MWSQSLLSDLVDIIISSEYYKKKLIFTNTKNQKNGEIYAQILVTLKEQASERDEEYVSCVKYFRCASRYVESLGGIRLFKIL